MDPILQPVGDDAGPGGPLDANTATALAPPFPPPVGDQAAPPREIGPFASFALNMSLICILAGGITSFHTGFCAVGGASIGIGWPLFCLFALVVALTMGQVVSAFPRAGGPCEWAAELGGSGWGWFAGCFNLLALMTALAAVNVGVCQFALSSLARVLQYDPATLPSWILTALVVATTLSQAFINHRGIRLTTLLTNGSGYLIMVTAVGLTLLLLICSAGSEHGIAFRQLFEFANFAGAGGGNVIPEPIDNVPWLFALGLLLPAYTLTGFDAAAQMAEETRDPDVNIPKAIWQAVLISGLAGWVMLSAVVMAAPSMEQAAAAGDQCFFWIIREATPRWTHAPLYTLIGLAQYFCGLACVTSASRLTWAMARDGGLPFARHLRRIGTHKTPTWAIWTVGVVGASLVFVPYSAIASVCAVFFYIAYVVPTACGLLTYGRWPRMGPWQLGRWYPPLAVVCLLGCLGLLVLAVQPPNDIALWVIPVLIVGLFALWFGYFRLVFRDEVNRALRKLAAFRDCHEVTVTPLGGGLTNRNYRVDIDGESYVLRIAGADADKLLIDRGREAVAMRSAAAAGIAPDLIDHLPDYSVMATRFVRGKQLAAEDLRQADGMRRVAQALRTCHDHPVSAGLGAFSAFDVVRSYFAQARAKNVPLPDDLARALRALDRIEDAVRVDDPHCLCHNDLLLGNFIDGGDSLLIIDWEYAGLGNRFFDLGNFAAHNQLSESEERSLLEHYFGEARPEDLRRLRLMRLVSDLREATWGYLQSAISSLYSPQHYRDYGRRFLDRFLAASTSCDLQ